MSLDKLAEDAYEAWESIIQEAADKIIAEFYPNHLDQETQRYVYEHMTPADYQELSQYPRFRIWVEEQRRSSLARKTRQFLQEMQ